MIALCDNIHEAVMVLLGALRFIRRRYGLCRQCQLIQAIAGCLFLSIAVYLVIVGGLYNRYTGSSQDVHSLLSIDASKLSLGANNQSSCVRPTLELWNQRLKKLFAPPPPMKCSTVDTNWVEVVNGSLFISQTAVDKHGTISCDYTPVYRGNDDFQILHGSTVKHVQNGSTVSSDVILVDCVADDGQRYQNTHATIAYNQQTLDRSRKLSRLLSANSLKLNIIMFGFDSVSRLTWMRNLPKSYDYLTTKLKAVVMEGYNVVGDGTPQALLPILTGFSEPELPEARRGFKNAQSVDDHPWIWSDLRDLGYVTQWGEESPNIGTFTYRMLGFRKQPVDHYMRTFYLAAEQTYYKHQPFCLGSEPRHRIMLNWVKDFLDTYRNQLKFSFLFHSEYSHEANSNLQWADDDLLEFLRYLDGSGHLDNSLLILMSDHGARFQNVRITEQGKYEERLPFLAIRVPTWFSDRYPTAWKNLQANADKLTSPFDLHATFDDVIDFGAGRRRGDENSPSRRGFSLFDEIPAGRTCADAAIEPHWCTCLSWQPVAVDLPEVQGAVNHVLETINQLTSVRVEKCARLKIGDVTNAVKYVAGKELLRFRQSADIHGRKADLSDNMKATVEFYQVTFITQPSGGVYEATVRHTVAGDRFNVATRDISRINKYGSQPKCVASELPHLRPYCYCIQQGWL